MAETEQLELDKFFPNLEIFRIEIDMRFSQIENMLEDKKDKKDKKGLEISQKLT